jgi:predicted acyltransferase
MSIPRSERLLSLDIFRGITIMGMILVNNPGSRSAVYGPLQHARWFGCTPTDLIFPFFSFITGVTTLFSLSKYKDAGIKADVYLRILRRFLILFFLGLFYDGFPHFDLGIIRIPGVLQRIALVYLFTSLIILHVKKEYILYVMIALLLGYWGLMTLVPVPGTGAPSLEPAANLGAWLDRLILDGHLWAFSKTWDPEGILGTLPAIGTSLIGVCSGYLLKSSSDSATKAAKLFYYGAILMCIGYIWCFWFPIGKSLWTSSYVCLTGGLALLFLGFCFWTIDVNNNKWWIRPFHIMGTNAIAAYFLSSLVAKCLYLIKITDTTGNAVVLKDIINNNLFMKIASPINASLLFALSYVLLGSL